MKKKLTNLPVIIFLLTAVVTVACSLLAKDWHKNDFLKWESLYAEVEQSSILITNSMLKIHSGFGSDYQQLTSRSALFAAQLDNLKKKIELAESRSYWERFVLLEPDIETLHILGQNFISSVEDFKINSAKLQNSTASTFVTLQKMREIEVTNSAEWKEILHNVEKQLVQHYVIKTNKSSEKLYYYVNRLGLQNRSRLELKYLDILGEQVKDIEIYDPAVTNIFNAHLRLEKMLGVEIGHLRVRTASLYAESIKKGEAAELSLSMLILFILVYGTYFAFRAINFSKHLEDSDRGLAFSVQVQTQNLKSRISLLETEYEAKQVEIKLLEAELNRIQKHEAFFRSITEAASNPILVVDENLLIRFSNDAANTLFECNKNGIEEMALSAYFPAIESIEQLIEASSQVMEGLTIKGSSLNLKASLSKLNQNDEAARYVCILHNLGDSTISYRATA